MLIEKEGFLLRKNGTSYFAIIVAIVLAADCLRDATVNIGFRELETQKVDLNKLFL